LQLGWLCVFKLFQAKLFIFSENHEIHNKRERNKYFYINIPLLKGKKEGSSHGNFPPLPRKEENARSINKKPEFAIRLSFFDFI